MDMARGNNGSALSWRRLLPLAVPVLGFLAFFLFDFDRFVTYEELHRRRMWLADQVEVHSLVAGIVFLFGYAAAVTFSPTVSMFLSIAGRVAVRTMVRNGLQRFIRIGTRPATRRCALADFSADEQSGYRRLSGSNDGNREPHIHQS